MNSGKEEINLSSRKGMRRRRLRKDEPSKPSRRMKRKKVKMANCERSR